MNEINKPNQCFCEVPSKELIYWTKKRYKEQILTVDLLNSTEDPHEREVIGIVGCLDIDDETFLKIFSNVSKSEQHKLHCRESLKAIIANL